MEQQQAINRAFSLQSFHYDEDDRVNPILQDMRQQVYAHLQEFLKPASNILELNAGTGIDALYLTRLGHHVHATDISEGMISQIEAKIKNHQLENRLTCERLSYDQLQNVTSSNFNYVFSNFGGLNCIADLKLVTEKLPALLASGAYVTWVIMPPVCPSEILWILKGDVRQATRRLNRNGTRSHLEGEYFQTYYHSLSSIKKAFGNRFRLVKCEGLAALKPQPHRGYFPKQYPRTYSLLKKTDSVLKNYFPFNRWADHIITTFQFLS